LDSSSVILNMLHHDWSAVSRCLEWASPIQSSMTATPETTLARHISIEWHFVNPLLNALEHTLESSGIIIKTLQ
jgi:hypothetical protein